MTVRCTHCSRVVRPVVAFDIDGTLGDYYGSLFAFCKLYFNIDFDENVYDGTQELEDVMGLSKADYRTMKLAYRQGGGKRLMPAFEGARELVEAVQNEGAEVWITTTRPWQRFDSTDPDTRHWLDRNRIPWDHIVFDDDKYGVLCSLVDVPRVVAVLEDLPAQYDRADELKLNPWLVKTKFNRGIQRGFEVRSLDVAARRLVQIVHDWEA